MTRWGALLLLVYLALGLSRVDRQKALHLAVGATAITIAAAMISIVR